MSVLTFGIGQCGNQICDQFFKTIYNDIYHKNHEISEEENLCFQNKSLEKWFRSEKNGKVSARAILIDSEDKVINSFFDNDSSISYEKCHKYSFGGAGNNFALGYYNIGPKVIESILNDTDKELDLCDSNSSGILIFLSTSGGTGSGIGTLLAEKLKEKYSKLPIVIVSILPFENGEVATQNYNTLFSLTHLNDCADMCVLIKNDQINEICSKVLDLNEVSFNDMNKIISYKLTNGLQPVINENKLNNINLIEIVDNLCTTNHRFINIRNTPYINYTEYDNPTYKWSVLLNHAKQMLCNVDWEIRKSAPKLSGSEHFLKCIGNVLVTRGKTDQFLNEKFDKYGRFRSQCDQETMNLSILSDDKLYSNTLSTNFKYLHSDRMLHCDKSDITTNTLALLTNNTSIYKQLYNVQLKSSQMFKSKAFCHQYVKYGLEFDVFKERIEKLDEIVKCYRYLE